MPTPGTVSGGKRGAVVAAERCRAALPSLVAPARSRLQVCTGTDPHHCTGTATSPARALCCGPVVGTSPHLVSGPVGCTCPWWQVLWGQHPWGQVPGMGERIEMDRWVEGAPSPEIISKCLFCAKQRECPQELVSMATANVRFHVVNNRFHDNTSFILGAGSWSDSPVGGGDREMASGT